MKETMATKTAPKPAAKSKVYILYTVCYSGDIRRVSGDHDYGIWNDDAEAIAYFRSSARKLLTATLDKVIATIFVGDTEIKSFTLRYEPPKNQNKHSLDDLLRKQGD